MDVDTPPASDAGSFADLALDTDLADDFSPEVEVAADDVVAPVVETPVVETPAVVTPPTVVAPAADLPAVPTPAPSSATPPAVPEVTPAPAVDFAALRTEALSAAATQYTVSEEDARLLMTEPEKVLPRLLADAQLRGTENAIRLIAQQLPSMMEKITSYKDSSTKAENTFYAAHPELKAHDAVVRDAVIRYRRIYPEATMQDVIDEVGAGLKIRLKIAPQPPAVIPRTVAPPRRPAGANAAPASAPLAPKPGENPFADLALFEHEPDE